MHLPRYGELVTPYSGGKQPYEVVLVGRRAGEGRATALQVPEELVMVSVPRSGRGALSPDSLTTPTTLETRGVTAHSYLSSGIHSHKPPLARVLEELVVGEEGRSGREVVAGLRKVEVFGRSLLPGWHTIGLQPCLLNMLPSRGLA